MPQGPRGSCSALTELGWPQVADAVREACVGFALGREGIESQGEGPPSDTHGYSCLSEKGDFYGP
jgi:hypothetical protein